MIRRQLLNFTQSGIHHSPAAHLRSVTHLLRTKQHALSTLSPLHSDIQNEGQTTSFRLNRFLRSFQRRLQLRQNLAASNYFRQGLDQGKPNNAERFLAYERAVSLFIKYGCFLEADELYGRLTNEGYLPSVSLKSRIQLLRLLSNAQSDNALPTAVGEIFKQSSFDESCLRSVLRMIKDNQLCSSDILNEVMRQFVATRPEGYTLQRDTKSLVSYIHTRFKSPEHAVEWLTVKDVESLVPDGRQKSKAETALINMARKDPANIAIYRAALARVQKTGSVHDLLFYNLLIAVHVRHARLDQAFNIYRLLTAGSTHCTMSPDVYTFGPIFAASHAASRRRTIHSRQLKVPHDLPASRHLFKDAVECHVKRTTGPILKRQQPILTGYLIDKALRMFMGQRDYAAAFVALRAFRACHVLPTLRTYRIIIGSLTHRIRKELDYLREAPDPKLYWTYRFLGHPSSPLEYDVRLLDGVLQFGTQHRLGLSPISLPAPLLECEHPAVPHEDTTTIPLPSPSSDLIQNDPVHAPLGPQRPVYRIPSAMQYLGLEETPAEYWDVIPLERILRRAMLASKRQIYVPPAKEVSMDIAEAKLEMIVS